MNRDHPVVGAAAEDYESVVALTQALVQVPSRSGVDACAAVLDRLGAWLAAHHVPTTVLTDSDGAPVGLACEIRGVRPGPGRRRAPPGPPPCDWIPAGPPTRCRRAHHCATPSSPPPAR